MPDATAPLNYRKWDNLNYDSTSEEEDGFVDLDEKDLIAEAILKDLMTAVCDGEEDKVKSLLGSAVFKSNAMTVNTQKPNGLTALHFAVLEDKPKMVKLLVQCGADPRIKTHDKAATPVLLGSTCGKLKAIHALVEATYEHSSPWSTKELLEEPADDGSTPLMEAASMGHLHLVRYLLDMGVDGKAKAKEGKTVMDKALDGGDEEIIALIRKKFPDLKAMIPVEVQETDEEKKERSEVSTTTASDPKVPDNKEASAEHRDTTAQHLKNLNRVLVSLEADASQSAE